MLVRGPGTEKEGWDSVLGARNALRIVLESRRGRESVAEAGRGTASEAASEGPAPESEAGTETRSEAGVTGGKGSFTQWVHGEFIVGSETICPLNIHWVQGEYF